MVTMPGMVGSVAFFPERYGNWVVPLSLAQLAGQELPPSVLIDHLVVTKTNICTYYADAPCADSDPLVTFDYTYPEADFAKLLDEIRADRSMRKAWMSCRNEPCAPHDRPGDVGRAGPLPILRAGAGAERHLVQHRTGRSGGAAWGKWCREVDADPDDLRASVLFLGRDAAGRGIVPPRVCPRCHGCGRAAGAARGERHRRVERGRENILLDRLPKRGRGGWSSIDTRRLHSDARGLLDRVGLDVDPAIRAGQLTLQQKRLVEVARALAGEARLLVLDEPTASMTAPEVEGLFATLGRLREAGTSIIYISHHISEVFRLCDRVLVLKDGRLVADRRISEADPRQVLSVMLGRPVANLYPAVQRMIGRGPRGLFSRWLTSSCRASRDGCRSTFRQVKCWGCSAFWALDKKPWGPPCSAAHRAASARSGSMARHLHRRSGAE